MKSKYYAVHFSDNWADEMDVESLLICNEKTANKYKAAFKALENYIKENGEYEIYVGTNEWIELEDAESFWVDSLNIDDATFRKLQRAGCTEIDPQSILYMILENFKDGEFDIEETEDEEDEDEDEE